VRRHTAYALAGATLVAGAAVLSGIRVLMVAGGLPLGLVLPGLALTALLFRRPGRLVTIERLMLVPALSLGTLILGGLLAWVVRAPLHRLTWLAVSAGVTLAALAAVLVIAPRGPAERPILPVSVDRFEPEPMNRRRRLLTQVVPAVLAVAMLAGAGWLSLATSIRTHQVTVTTLSVVPPGGADASGDRSIQVNATGLAGGPDAYALQVTSATRNTRTAVTADERGLWTSTLRLPGDERLTLALYRAGGTSPLRTVIVASAATG
jgi:uncharacterized membrane protein